jgi:hypothetical protein
VFPLVLAVAAGAAGGLWAWLEARPDRDGAATAGAALGGGWRRLGLGGPSSAEGLVQADERVHVLAHARGLVDLGGEQGPLSIEHLEIGGDAAPVAKLGELHDLALGFDPLLLRASLVSRLFQADERVLDLPECLEERPLVVVDRLALLRLPHFHAPFVLSRVVYRLKERGKYVPVRGRPIEELAQVGARDTERPGEADPGYRIACASPIRAVAK